MFCGLWLALEGNAFASGARLTHLGHLMADEAAGENAPELSLNFGSGIRFGSISIDLESTRLENIQSRFGGALHTHGAAVGQVTWLCYMIHAPAGKRSTIWFITSSPGSGPDAHLIGLIALQQVDASKSDGCTALPAGTATLTLGVPSLGTTPAELKRHFGQLPYDKLRNVYYDSVRAVAGETGKSVYQRLAYVVTQKRIVVGVAVAQTTN